MLASQSPRRREILANAGIRFVVRAAPVPEELQPGETAEEYVRRLAWEKAAATERAPGETILSADTVVVVGDAILEKPRDPDDARRMLRLLSGREHQVLTGICLHGPAVTTVELATTLVRFAGLTEREIDDYVSTAEPLDKGGAYAIQGLASKFIEAIHGCYFNVMGLPIALVYRRLKQAGLA